VPLQTPDPTSGQPAVVPDSNLHELNQRVSALENLVADLEGRLNGHFTRLQILERRAVQFDPQTGDVALSGHLNVAKDVRVQGDVKLLS
jgi:hypothetical protein